MANRASDWLKQAEGDLSHSKNARTAGDYDWAVLPLSRPQKRRSRG